AVYDSLLFFHISKLPDHFYIVFNLKTGKELGYFCPKGHGPNELRNLSPIYRLYMDSGDLKTFLAAPDNFKLVEWNISKSIETGKTVWDFIPYDWRKDHEMEFPHSFIFKLNDREFVGNIKSLCLNLDENCTKATLLSLEKRTIHTNTRLMEYTIYKKMLNRSDSYRFFDAHTCTKSDGSKIVQFMTHLWQINVVNLETGEIAGYRKRHTPDYAYLSNFPDVYEKLPYYFISGAVVNDHYIFIKNKNGTTLEDENGNCIVYVFDWNCNLIKKLKLGDDMNSTSIFLDKVNNLLYTYHWENEKIFCYDLNSVGL
ncbi:MAG: hypothetical protein LBD59_02850, partial [Prevotellaceae bacterium]|nr:hypothetical protein [Prevotellaceae bacterium]